MPHQLSQRDQEPCAVAGHRINAGDAYAVLALRDRRWRGRMFLYPHGTAGPRVVISDDAARTLAEYLGRSS